MTSADNPSPLRGWGEGAYLISAPLSLLIHFHWSHPSLSDNTPTHTAHMRPVSNRHAPLVSYDVSTVRSMCHIRSTEQRTWAVFRLERASGAGGQDTVHGEMSIVTRGPGAGTEGGGRPGQDRGRIHVTTHYLPSLSRPVARSGKSYQLRTRNWHCDLSSFGLHLHAIR